MVSQVGEASPTCGLQWHTAHHSDQHEKGYRSHLKLEATEQHWRNSILAVGHQKTTRDVRVVVSLAVWDQKKILVQNFIWKMLSRPEFNAESKYEVRIAPSGVVSPN